MLRKALYLGLIGLTASLVSFSALAKKPGGPDYTDDPYNGNGSPSGSHYTLNLLGKEWNHGSDIEPEDTNGNGRRIFVGLGNNGNPRKTKIFLGNSGVGDPCDGKDFCVTDYDGTDGVAEFYLPNPDDNCDGQTDWSVYIRVLGPNNPDYSATMETCAYNEGSTFCDGQGDVLTLGPKNNGAAQFTNVSLELFYVEIDNVRYSIFGDTNADYWWDYNNQGLRHVQARFYEITTDAGSYTTDTFATVGCKSDDHLPTTTTTTAAP
jgi:hypothetical protein